MGFVNTLKWKEKVEADLGFEMSRATSFRWARHEKMLQQSGGTDSKGRKAVSNKSDASFTKLMEDLEASKRSHAEMKTVPDA